MEIAVKAGKEAVKLLRELSEDEKSFMKVEEGKETILADKKSEELIVDYLYREGIRGRYIAEESGVFSKGNENIVAIIDPLDGSKNYVRGVKWCAVSIAFAVPGQMNLSDVVAGSVHSVFWDEAFSFYKGGGLFVNGERREKIKAEKVRLDEGYYAVYIDEKDAAAFVKAFRDFLASKGKKATFRSLGSAAMELALVSLGKIDAFVDARAKLRIVDVAAGAGMVLESGGTVKEINGGNLEKINYSAMQSFETFLASSNESIAEEIIHVYKTYKGV